MGSLPAKQVSTCRSGFWARSSLLARPSAAFPPRRRTWKDLPKGLATTCNTNPFTLNPDPLGFIVTKRPSLQDCTGEVASCVALAYEPGSEGRGCARFSHLIGPLLLIGPKCSESR